MAETTTEKEASGGAVVPEAASDHGGDGGDSGDQGDDRFAAWFAVFVCNLIAFVSLVVPIGGTVSSQPQHVQWAVSALSINLAFAVIAVIAHMVARSRFVCKTIEGVMALVVLAFWAAVMPTLMNPGHQLATGDFGMIGDSNLYFFSWLGLIGSFVVFVRYLKAAYGLGACGAAEKDSKTFKAQTWAGLVLTSFVVFVSASRLCQNANCNAGNSEYDKRTKLAISIGVISAVISLIWMAVGSRVHVAVDAVSTVVVVLLWIFGIIFITFGGFGTAPGAVVGNLYFFTWASFLLSVFLTADVFNRLNESFGKGKDTVAHHDEAETSGHQKAEEGSKEGGDETKKDVEEGGDKAET